MNSPASSLAFAFLFAAFPALAAPKGTKAEKAAPPAKALTTGISGWLDWRGPLQTGVSLEKGLPVKVDAKAALWTADFPGQSIPVIANGKLYIMGYLGEGADLQEGVACFDAETGKLLWKQLFNDFLSDVIYLRYANSAPTVDDRPDVSSARGKLAPRGHIPTCESTLFCCRIIDGSDDDAGLREVVEPHIARAQF